MNMLLSETKVFYTMSEKMRLMSSKRDLPFDGVNDKNI